MKYTLRINYLIGHKQSVNDISSHFILRYLCIPSIYRKVTLPLFQVLQIYGLDLPHILHVHVVVPLQIGSARPEEPF